MRIFSSRILLVAAAAAVTLQSSVVAAAADEATWTVSAGGRTSAVNYGILLFQDLNSGATVTCDSSEMIARFRTGTDLSGTGLMQITYGTVGDVTTPDGNCVGPGSTTVHISPRGLPWKMNATSYDVQTGTITGTLTSSDTEGVGAIVKVSDGCEIGLGGPGTAKGEVQVTYSNSTGVLSFADTNLVLKSFVGPCHTTMLQAGDQVFISADYEVTPRQTITAS